MPDSVGKELERLLGVPDVSRLREVEATEERAQTAARAARKLGILGPYQAIINARRAPRLSSDSAPDELWERMKGLLDPGATQRWW